MMTGAEESHPPIAEMSLAVYSWCSFACEDQRFSRNGRCPHGVGVVQEGSREPLWGYLPDTWYEARPARRGRISVRGGRLAGTSDARHHARICQAYGYSDRAREAGMAHGNKNNFGA
jgi:hypothetical protein